MSITPIKKLTQATILRAPLPKQLIVTNRRAVTKTIEQAVERGYRVVEFDASEMAYIDSSGLGALADGARMLDAVDGVLLMKRPQKDVTILLRLTRVDEVVYVQHREAGYGEMDCHLPHVDPEPPVGSKRRR